jgi:hypothetical protein
MLVTDYGQPLRVILGRGSRRIHLLMGGYLSAMVLAVTVIALANPPFSIEPDATISLAVIALLAGIGFVVVARLERLWVSIVAVPFGVLATLASALYHHIDVPLQSACAFGRVNIGFPLPYRYAFIYTSTGPGCIVPLLPLYPIHPGTNMVSFSLDVIFYVAVGVAIIQFYRGITGKTITPGSTRTHNMI